MKKIIVIVLAFAILGAGGWYVLSQKNKSKPANETKTNSQAAEGKTEITVKIKQGTDDPAKVNALQKQLAKLFLDYRQAQILTNALLLLDTSTTTKEGYLAFNRGVINEWAKVEEDANALKKQEVGWQNLIITPFRIENALADEAVPSLLTDSNDIKPVEFKPIDVNSDPSLSHKNYKFPSDYKMPDLSGDNPTAEKQLNPSKWELIDTGKAMMPESKILELVQNSFGVTAKDAKNLLEKHYQDAASGYNDQAEFMRKCSVTAQTVGTISKVGLFIGGAVITAGGSTVLTGGAGTALATGFGSNIGVVGGTTILISGTDVVLEVGENVSSLAFGDNNAALGFKELRNKISPLTTLINIVDLKNGLSNPGNLVTIADWGQAAIGYGYDSIMAEINDQDLKIKMAKVPDNKTYFRADNGAGLLPGGYTYLTAQPGSEPTPATPPATDANLTAPQKLFGSYRAVMNVPYHIAGETIDLKIDSHIILDKDGKITFELSDKGNTPYIVPGMTLHADWTLKGNIAGTMDASGKITADKGNFSTQITVKPSPGMELPKQVLDKMSGGATGTATADGIGADKKLSGNATFTANGITEKGTWQTVE